MAAIQIHDVIGTLGVVAIVVMYVLVQLRRIDTTRPLYSIVNGIGAALILVSLCFAFNLSAVLIEGFWLVFSVYGLIRALRERRTR